MPVNHFHFLATWGFRRLQGFLGSSIELWPISHLMRFLWRLISSSNGIAVEPISIIHPGEASIEIPSRERFLVSSVSELKLEKFTMVQQEANKIVGLLDLNAHIRKVANTPHNFRLDLLPDRMEEKSNTIFYSYAIQPNIVSIVQNYLGFAPRLLDVQLSIDFPVTSAPKESQLWHRDPDDLYNIKVFTYLNDVDLETGPNCLIPFSKSLPIYSKVGLLRRYPRGRRFSDSEMREFVREKDWQITTGEAGTVIFADTCSCYHKGAKVASKNRLMLTLVYSSLFPIREWR